MNIIRICPLKNGTVVCHRFDGTDYVWIKPNEAVELLANEDTSVEVAVPDPGCRHSHYESAPSKMKRI